MAGIDHTVGGTDNLVSFRSAAQVPIDSLKIHFAPIQEGEGNPSPTNVRPITGWNAVEGYKTGKNIAEVLGYSAVNGINADDHTRLTNSYGTTISTTDYVSPDTPLVITQSEAPNTGAASSYSNGYVCIYVKNLIYGEYYDISFKVTNVTSNLLNINLTSFLLLSPAGIAYTPTLIDGNILIYRNVRWMRYRNDPSISSYNRSNFEIRICGMSFTLSEFMVTPAGMNDGVFEPYCGSRIPVEFPKEGKNKFSMAEANTSNWTGEGFYNAYYNRMNPVIDIETGTISIMCLANGDSILYRKTQYAPGTYTLSYDMTYSSGHTRTPAKRMVIICFSNDGTILTNEDVSIDGGTWNSYYKGFFSLPRTFTVPDTVDHFSIAIGISDDTAGETATFSNIQLELGTVATEYEPYQSLGDVYGGYIDPVKGELVQTHKSITLDGSQEFEVRSSGIYYIYTVADMKTGTFYTDPGSKCDRIREVNVRSDEDLGIKIGADTPKFYFYNFNKVYGFTDAASFSAWLHDNPVTVTYPLANPIHYPLTPTQLKTFLDQNTFWSNTNDVTEVSYAIHDSADIRAAKRRIAMASPHTEIVSDELAHFKTDISAPLKECKVYFSPVREGEGDPSPNNIRPISGWNGIDVHKCGKNLFDISEMSSRNGVTVDGNIFVGSAAAFRCYGDYSYGYGGKRTPLYIPKNIPINISCTAYSEGNISTEGAGFSPRFCYKNGSDVRPWYTRNTALTSTLYNGTITPTDDIEHYVFGWYNYSENIWHVSNMQFEIGSEMTEYEPYTGETVSFAFPSEVGTIYGGYIDLTRGILTETQRMFASTWGELTLRGHYGDGTMTVKKFVLDIPVYPTGDSHDKSFSNIVPKIWKFTECGDPHYYVGDSRTIWVFLPSDTNNDTLVQIVCNLAEPVIHQLDSITIKTLKGINNIWSDANGPIEVKYWTH